MARQFSSSDSSVWNDRYGSGADGSYLPSTKTDDTPNINVISSNPAGGYSLLVASNSGFTAGTLVLIYQPILGSHGTWELNKITSIGSGTDWTMTYPLQATYVDGAQVYKLFQYSSATINSSVTVTGRAFNGSYGGLFALLVNGTATINGVITVAGLGFRGGYGGDKNANMVSGGRGENQYERIYDSRTSSDNTKIAPYGMGGGGGGGNQGGTGGGNIGGGGGGGHAAAGSNAGQNMGGVGGSPAGVSTLTSLYFGGGGGGGGVTPGNPSFYGGTGGRGGGGIIIIAKNIIIGTGSLRAYGAGGGCWANADGFSGAGGAGGSVLLKGQTVTFGDIQYYGGAAGCNTRNHTDDWGRGGPGSVGRFAVYYSSSATSTTYRYFDFALTDPNPNWVKANIRRNNNTQGPDYVKSNILRRNYYPGRNYVKARMIKFRGNFVNTSVANIRGNQFYKKQYSYKAYYSATDIRDVWGREVINEPSFRMTINGGPGEMVVRLARKIDAFGEGEDIVLNRKIDVYVYDRDASGGELLFQGYISGYAPTVDGPKEYVDITLLGYVAEIGQRIFKDGAGNTTVAYTNSDPSNILKDIIGKYRADSGNLNYSSSSIELTGTSVSYTFSAVTVKEAMDKIIELTPYDWFYRIDPDGLVYLKKRSITADHKLYIGKHINYMKPEKRLDSLVNTVYFIGGTPDGLPQLYRKYARTSSVSTYGLREQKMQDSRVTLTTTADIKANRYLDEREAPETRTLIRVIDNGGESGELGYDIESIKPGHTISVENLKSSTKLVSFWDQLIWDSGLWDFNISLITSDVLTVNAIQYYPGYIEIEASRALPVVEKRIEDIQKNLEAVTNAELPTKPVSA
jgi:hypothetical protein